MRIPLLRHLCRHPRKWTLLNIFRVFFVAVLVVLVTGVVLAYLMDLAQFQQVRGKEVISRKELVKNVEVKKKVKTYRFPEWDKAPLSVVVSSGKEVAVTNNKKNNGNFKRSMFNSFDIHKCGKNGDHKLTVYLYPFQRWEVNGVTLPSPSRQFLEFLDAIRKSQYWVENPEDACILIPTIDTFHIEDGERMKIIKAALSSLPWWGSDGENHVVVSFSLEGKEELLKTGAIVASGGFPIHLYRPGFYVPLIVPNSLVPVSSNDSNHSVRKEDLMWLRKRQYTAISAEPLPLDDDSVLVLEFCKGRGNSYGERCRGKRVFNHPQILKEVDFCIIWRDLNGPLLWDILSVGCIPVIFVDFQRLPFDDVIDWSRLTILFHEHELSSISTVLRSVSTNHKKRLKSQVEFIFHKYFVTMHQITYTLLEVLQDRIFSHHARTLQVWNQHPRFDQNEQPFFNPASLPGDNGFTAVVLAYERVPSLFEVIRHISQVPSLVMILVVWNNQKKPPPEHSAWPKVNKTIKIVKMETNRMSNRFYPFDDIETEAVFSLDDDIVMLTADEIEFGFQTWREFPERIVGFPSRSHVWDTNTGRWRYESEWTNEISMVLTGAAFYHKYWHYAFTHEMPKEIKELVDSKMNCEDIAMNFLVSATTGQSPIKVTPRKKFKCPTCSTNEMLSSDSSHMIQRTDCINRFSQSYGRMPLISVEWRADPVLYKVENLSPKLKKFRDIGSL